MRLSPSIVLLRTQSDERLTALARDGHDAAFTALVERYRRVVLVTCRRVLADARAEDAAQQTFVSAWRALSRGDDVLEVRAWLLRIARNTALNALRTPGYDYEELAASLQGNPGPEAELEQRDVVRQTLAGLAALPENQREALLRTAVQGLGHADLARDLGLSEGATRQLVFRARANMRSAVSALVPLPLVTSVASGSAVSAGAGAFAAKAGVAVVLAGGVVATPVIVSDKSRPEPARVQVADRLEQNRRARASAKNPSEPIASAVVAAAVQAEPRPRLSQAPRSTPTVNRPPSKAKSPRGTHEPSGADGFGAAEQPGTSGDQDSPDSETHHGDRGPKRDDIDDDDNDDDDNSHSGSEGPSVPSPEEDENEHENAPVALAPSSGSGSGHGGSGSSGSGSGSSGSGSGSFSSGSGSGSSVEPELPEVDDDDDLAEADED